MLTSIPELSVGVSSVIDREPAIFVGDLIGASFVLFMFIIPLLAVVGNGITLSHQLTRKNLVLCLFVIFTPLLFVANGSIDRVEGLFMILIYILLVYIVERSGFIEETGETFIKTERGHWMDIVKLISGALMIFLSSKLLVDNTIYMGNYFNVHTSIISLVILSFGTNLPEFIITMRAMLSRNDSVALGDYIGSAAANTFIFGLLVLMHGTVSARGANFILTFILFLAGLILFYVFSRSNNKISRSEGVVLLLIYGVFIYFELIHKNIL